MKDYSLAEQLERAKELLTLHREHLNKIAQVLVAEETLEQEKFYELVKDIVPADKPRPSFHTVAPVLTDELTSSEVDAEAEADDEASS
jgi:hypothetical protein